MEQVLEMDIESFSDVDLIKCGVYAYADSPAFEILLFAYSFDGGETQIIDLAQGERLPAEVEEGCPGIWVPAEATEGWQIEGKAVVTESTDEFGVKSYSFMEKAAYERRRGCPYRQNISKGEK